MQVDKFSIIEFFVKHQFQKLSRPSASLSLGSRIRVYFVVLRGFLSMSYKP